MGLGTLVRNAITYATDYVGKNNVSTGAIKKLDTDIGQVFSAVSTDGTMADNSDDALPTEKAVVTYAGYNFIKSAGDSVQLHSVLLTITDAADASKIKVSGAGYYVQADIAAVDNIAKGATVSYISLDAAGDTITFQKGSIDENAKGVLSGHITYNASGTDIHVEAVEDTPTRYISLTFSNATSGAAVDLTTLVDSGDIRVLLTWLGAQ